MRANGRARRARSSQVKAPPAPDASSRLPKERRAFTDTQLADGTVLTTWQDQPSPPRAEPAPAAPVDDPAVEVVRVLPVRPPVGRWERFGTHLTSTLGRL